MLARKIHSNEDSLLLIQMSKGDHYAFEMLYERYWTDVLDEAFRRLSDIDLAKDVAQEVFTYLWVKAKVVSVENLPAWLYTVVKNQVFRQMKKHERFVPLPDLIAEMESLDDDTDAPLLRKELVTAYQMLIASLPHQQRIIFQMRYMEQLTPDEIAAKLNISPKTVRNHLGRALGKLKAVFIFINLLVFISGK